jgi:nucleotide-binding universal stress UspA family protein
MSLKFTGSVVVPIANEEDAIATAEQLERYDVGEMTVVHVIEKGEGVPDKTPVEQSQNVADDAFAAFRNRFPDSNPRQVYRRDVVEGILDAARDVDADAIVFRPRGGSRLVQFLAGDKALRLVTESDRPVVALPDDGESSLER